MSAFKLAFYLALLWAGSPALAALSDKRLCIDPQCSELIAEGKTRLRYNGIAPGMLSFARDEPVLIYSFGGGSRPELIGVEIGGRRGFVNADHVVETRRLKSPKLLVDVEAPPLPTTTQSAFEIVDGTRIPLDLQEFTTEAPVGGPFQPTEPLEHEEDGDEDEEEPVAQAPPAGMEESAERHLPPAEEAPREPPMQTVNDSSAAIEEPPPAPVELNQVPPPDPLNASPESVEEASLVSQVPPTPEPVKSSPESNEESPLVSQEPPPPEPHKSSPESIEEAPPVSQEPPPEPVNASPESVEEAPLVKKVPPTPESNEESPLVSQVPPPPEPINASPESIEGAPLVNEVHPPEPPPEPLKSPSESTEGASVEPPEDDVNQQVPPPEPPAEPFNSSASELTGERSLEPVEERIDQAPPASETLEQTVTAHPEEPVNVTVSESPELTLNASASVLGGAAAPPGEATAPSEAAGWLLKRLGRPADEETCARGNETQQLDLLGAFTTDMFLYLSTTALAVLVLIFVWVLLDKWRRAAPLIARINGLEQQLLATSKENEALQSEPAAQPVAQPDDGRLAQLNEEKLQLQAQVQALEKELDDSTEMGIELNRIIGEMLQSSDGSDILKENIEQMQKRLQQQQELIGGLQEGHALKEAQLQAAQEQLELVRLELGAQQAAAERQLQLQQDLSAQQQKTAELERELRTKTMQYDALKLSVKDPQQVEGSEARAQLQQLQADNRRCAEQLKEAREAHRDCPAQLQALAAQLQQLRAHYEQTEREKVESCTKLTVLTSYFKEKEERMLKEISHYEALWSAKEGEATTTSQLSRHLQEELQNYKAQNDSLKQEIVSQEVALKSQISLLEKQAHERWVASRQAERKLEEARQEAALLRNRLTLTERSQLRVQSPLLQNGELALSPDPAQSPPPPLAFLPPPLGGRPFMLPPPADMGLPPPFIPGMFPGDHRPPPLGRMSSPPPAGGRYSPESTVYSEYERYDRRSPSPPYDSEYGASPPLRSYSPYEREYRRSNGRHLKGAPSSGSDNEAQGRAGRKPHRKV
ncbi:transport and Golgi organization protein 1 isoform X2 [Dendroctonus ponderosae]|uniref:transport and Golgi organization protein 1 isoform X2 n=1 Tax=Dendroctonus ponderosae TaxID=77166 RepID=UPI002035009A|nr:transport and Golgi organization protein 1 isoform X2 [Dendroctonus ponderosae]